MVVTKLAAGEEKAKIARDLEVHETTLYKWLRDDPAIKSEVEELETAAYQKARDKIERIAFADIEISSASQMQALTRILDKYEAKLARQAGEVNQEDVTVSIMHICQILVGKPDVTKELLDAYRQSRRSDHSGDAGPDGVPPQLPEGGDTSSG